MPRILLRRQFATINYHGRPTVAKTFALAIYEVCPRRFPFAASLI